MPTETHHQLGYLVQNDLGRPPGAAGCRHRGDRGGTGGFVADGGGPVAAEGLVVGLGGRLTMNQQHSARTTH